jgi:prepilin-type N-terminal cleavage/methylation domain-containing protein
MTQRLPASTVHRRESGFTIVESLITVVIVGLALSASTTLLLIALRGRRTTASANAEQAAIEANKAQIDRIAREFTCCSGSCVATPPTTFGATQPCFTNNPNDDRYYFPQLDLASTTSLNEPVAVDQLCSNANNATFMAPFKTAVDNLSQPTPATRLTSTILNYKTLRVQFNNSSGNLVRTLYLRPRMANFCS